MVTSVAIAPNGRLIASASGDHSIRLWDAVSGGHSYSTLKGHTDRVTSVTFSTDSRLISGSWDKEIYIWATDTGRVRRKMKQGAFVDKLVAAPDGNYILSIDLHGKIYKWDARSGTPVDLTFEEGLMPVNAKSQSKSRDRVIEAVSISSDSSCFACSRGRGIIDIYDAVTGTLKVPTIGPAECLESPNAIPYQSDTGTLYESDYEEAAFRHGWHCPSLTFTRNGKVLASGQWDPVVRFWSTESGKPVRSALRGHTGKIIGLAFADKDETLISASTDSDKTIRMWNWLTGECLAIYEGPQEGLNCLALSADERFIVSGGDDGSVRVWDAAIRKMPMREMPTREILTKTSGRHSGHGTYETHRRDWFREQELAGPTHLLNVTEALTGLDDSDASQKAQILSLLASFNTHPEFEADWVSYASQPLLRLEEYMLRVNDEPHLVEGHTGTLTTEALYRNIFGPWAITPDFWVVRAGVDETMYPILWLPPEYRPEQTSDFRSTEEFVLLRLRTNWGLKAVVIKVPKVLPCDN